MSDARTERVLVVPTQVFRDLGYFPRLFAGRGTLLGDVAAAGAREFSSAIGSGRRSVVQATHSVRVAEAQRPSLPIHARQRDGRRPPACEEKCRHRRPYLGGRRRRFGDPLPRGHGARTDGRSDRRDEVRGALRRLDQPTTARRSGKCISAWCTSSNSSVRTSARAKTTCGTRISPLADIRAEFERFESWSQLCIEALFPNG